MKNTFATTAAVLALTLSASASFAGYAAPQNRLNNTETSSFFAKSAPSVLSRSVVKNELSQAVKTGNLPARGENSGVVESSTTSTTSRSAVKADFLQAQKAGTLPPMGNRS